jgi:hypothetical protein
VERYATHVELAVALPVSTRSSDVSLRNTALPRVRELTFEDYPQVAAVCRRNGRRQKSRAEWQHRWQSNPLYRALNGDWSMGWLLECGNEVCGCIENIPVPYEMHGRPLIAAVGCSWAVDPPYRGYAALLADYFYNQSRPDLCLGTTVNAEAFAVLTELGVQKIPVGAWDRTGVWITDHAAFAYRWLRAKRVPLARPIGSLLGAAMFIVDKAKSGIDASTRDIEIALCRSFDGRFDIFWEKLKAQNQARLLPVRTSEVLHWHFAAALRENRLWIATISDVSGMVAFAIFLRRDDPNYGHSRVLLVDFQFVDDNAHLLLPMLSWALQRCRREKALVLENLGLHVGTISTAHLPAYVRHRQAWGYVYKANDRTLANVLKNPNVWAPSAFDGDITL